MTLTEAVITSLITERTKLMSEPITAESFIGKSVEILGCKVGGNLYAQSEDAAFFLSVKNGVVVNSNECSRATISARAISRMIVMSGVASCRDGSGFSYDIYKNELPSVAELGHLKDGEMEST